MSLPSKRPTAVQGTGESKPLRVRIAHEHYRTTAGEYVRRLRLEFAARKLAAGETPLVEVVLEAAFADQCQFTLTFRALMGVPPGEHRRLRRGF